MALSVIRTTRPTSNSIAALLINEKKIRKRPLSEIRPRGLFCKNGIGFSINAKFMFDSRPDSFQSDDRPTLEQVLKEIRETQWQVNSHKGPFRVAFQGIPGAYSEEAARVSPEGMPPATDRPQKTSIVIGHDDDGSVDFLFIVLSTFLSRGINLSKLERSPGPGWEKMTSNPLRGEMGLNAKPFQHAFYIDFEASVVETRVQNALAELQELTSFMRVLGSYPTDPKDQEI